MGFEAFRVEFRGGNRTVSEASEVLRKLTNIRPDDDSLPMPGSAYYVVNDGRHAIEIELMDSPLKLSCRFTLCHSPSVDSVFLSLVRELMIRLEMEAKICDDVPPEHSHAFSVN